MSARRTDGIRFGVLCAGDVFPAWQAAALRELRAVEGVVLALLILDSSIGRNATRPSPPLLFRLYRRLFLRCASLRSVDMGKEFLGIPTIGRPPKSRDDPAPFTSADLEEVRRSDLDFILTFHRGATESAVLEAARLGVWRPHPGDEELYGSEPTGFWELFNGDRVSSCSLQRLTRDRHEVFILRKGFVATRLHAPAAHVDRLHFESARWPARICRQLLADLDEALPAERGRQSTAAVYPTNAQMVVFGFRVLRHLANWTCRALFRHDAWSVGIVDAPIHAFLEPTFRPRPRLLHSPRKERYFADPFGISVGNVLNVVCEDFDYRRSKGVISRIEVRPDGSYSDPSPLLEAPFHLSYPCLVEHEGKFYCTPETLDAREIALYEARPPDYRLQKVAILLGGIGGADPTLFHYRDLWWLAYALDDHGSMSDLYLWYSTSLFGPYRPHVANPVKQDVRSARPAGTPFVHEGSLYRPAQDCSAGYGHRIVLCRVDRLSPRQFEERPVAVIGPYSMRPFSEGIHTLSAAGSVTLIDGRHSAFVAQVFARRIWRGIRGLPEGSDNSRSTPAEAQVVT